MYNDDDDGERIHTAKNIMIIIIIYTVATIITIIIIGAGDGEKFLRGILFTVHYTRRIFSSSF